MPKNTIKRGTKLFQFHSSYKINHLSLTDVHQLGKAITAKKRNWEYYRVVKHKNSYALYLS